MDFSSLLDLASEKQGENKIDKYKKANCSFKVPPAKKTPREKKLSNNVKKFLEKRDQIEEQRKKEEAKKRQHLLQLRRENSKSTRTMKSMLQMTKSANKSAIADAKSTTDTADTLIGRNQCDEDDYGYESQGSRGIYEKLMAKYEKNPEDPMAKFTKILNPKKAKDRMATLERVKNSLENADEEQVRERKERHREKKKESKKSEGTPYVEEKKPKKNRDEEEARKRRLALAQKAPPPPSFQDLIKLAQVKHKEPIKFEKKKVKESEFGRPMTQKEKDEYMRERESHLRKAGKLQPKAKVEDNKNNNNDKAKNSAEVIKKSSESSSKVPPVQAPPEKKRPVITGPEFHPAVVGKNKLPNKISERRDERPEKKSKSPPQPSTSKKRPRSRSPSPISKKSSNCRNRIESESEEDYDSEMDDFIDDSDAKIDISAEIRGLFGYDRRKYKDEEDFDDRSMENNKFSDLMKEEARSAKIGLMEDLEDMKKEEEEKKRKKMMKKKSR